PGADLVGGQQDLTDSRENGSEHDHGSLFNAVVDLRDWHSGSPGVRAKVSAGGGAPPALRGFIVSSRPVHPTRGPGVCTDKVSSTASPTAGDSASGGLAYDERHGCPDPACPARQAPRLLRGG